MENKPIIGKWYSPYENGNVHISQLVREDKDYYYFSDNVKYSKEISWSWYEREEIIEQKEEDYQTFIFPYESYSDWSKLLAKQYDVDHLKTEFNKCEELTEVYSIQHLNAIKATTSMTSQSQRRAHSRNKVTGNYEKKMALKNAIEIHKYYPEKCKKS
jgi:hypothetical protein